MNFYLQISLIIGVTIYFIMLFYLIKKKSLDLKYSLLWIFSGIIMYIVVMFPNIVLKITETLGIIDMTNGLFALVMFFEIMILMSITAIVSKMKVNNKKLIQECALLEKRVRELEEKIKK